LSAVRCSGREGDSDVTNLILIRHAAHGQLGHRIVGRSPGVHLSPDGRQQAQALAGCLHRAPIRGVYSSPLERARATAEPIATRLGIEPQIAEELNEIDFGEWTNRPLEELDQLAEWRCFNAFRSGTRIPHGETMIEVQARVLRLVERLDVVRAGQTVALVSHGDVIRAALAHWLGMPVDLLARIEISPASLSMVRIDAWGPKVLLINGSAEVTLPGSERAVAP